jgi:hypothetical protein
VAVAVTVTVCRITTYPPSFRKLLTLLMLGLLNAYTNYAQTFKTLEINFLPQVTYLGNFMKHSFIFGRLILEGILIMNFRKRYVKCETHFFLAYFSEQNWQFETNQVFITHNSILRWITKFPDSNNLA